MSSILEHSRRRPALRPLTPWAAGLLLTACAAAAPPAVPIPASEGSSLAETLERSTRIDSPSMFQFDWSLSEQGARVSGRGVARAQAPYRARLDLFTGSGETLARAALKDGELCLPPEVPQEIIPPANLLWAALGVFRPGPDARLLGAGRSGETIELTYSSTGDRELRYFIEREKVRAVELLQDGRVLHRITLTPTETTSYPQDATYRNMAAFRELKLVTRSVENVETYPADTWLPPC